MRLLTLALLMMLAMPARADHTKEDAKVTTAKLDAILHPPKRRHAPRAQTQTQTQTQPVDPLYALIVYALTTPVQPR
jgi:hypothetical protein